MSTLLIIIVSEYAYRISQQVTPKLHTSDLVLYCLFSKLSGAIHLIVSVWHADSSYFNWSSVTFCLCIFFSCIYTRQSEVRDNRDHSFIKLERKYSENFSMRNVNSRHYIEKSIITKTFRAAKSLCITFSLCK